MLKDHILKEEKGGNYGGGIQVQGKNKEIYLHVNINKVRIFLNNKIVTRETHLKVLCTSYIKFPKI